jgi:hypothetical protein
MATIQVNSAPNSGTNITVQDSNNITANIVGGNNINLGVVPTPTQIVQINRGVAGPSGNDNIGGYPVVISSPQNYDVIAFYGNQWINNPQTEITDGGNY